MRLFAKKDGFTLTEVLASMAIICIIASLVFVLSAPAREKARQASCGSQLSQIYKALMLYSGDENVAEEFPGVPGISLYALEKTRVLQPYTKSKDIFYCPDAPAIASKHMATTYTVNLEPIDVLQSSAYGNLYITRYTGMLAERGQTYPLIYCNVHDEVFYQAGEKDINPLLTQPFIVEVQLSGNIVSRRESWLRSRQILNVLDQY